MIQLNDYLYYTQFINEGFISDSLINAFSGLLDNTTLLLEKSVENQAQKNNDFIKKVIELKFSINQLNADESNLENDDILDLVTTKYNELKTQYDELLKKWFNDVAIKLLGLTNNKELTTKDLETIRKKGLANNSEAFKENPESHAGNETINEIKNALETVSKEIQKFKDDASKKLKETKHKELKEKFDNAQREWAEEIKNLEDEYKNAGTFYSSSKTAFEIQSTDYALKIFDENVELSDAEKHLEEYIKIKDEQIKIIKDKKQELDDFDANYNKMMQDRDDMDISPEAEEIKDKEDDVLKAKIIQLVLNQFKSDNLIKGDLDRLRGLFNELVSNIDKNREKNKNADKVIKDSAKVKDNNAFIGLNLMLISATALYGATKNAKTILQFGGAVSKSIKLNKFDDAFIPDKEEKK